jgi:hypothetical protein
MGASVPTTNAGPVGVLGFVVFVIVPLEQPVANIPAADSKRIASLKGIFEVLGDISCTPLSAGLRSF